MHGSILRTSVATVALTASALAIAACGSSSSSSSSSSSTGGGGAAKSSIKPQTIGVVDIIRQSPIDSAMDDAMTSAGQQIGWTVKVQDAAGNPQTVVSDFQTFITQRVNAIVLISVDANSVRAQLAAAKSANIPVIEIGAGVTPSTLWSAQIGEDETKITQVLADYMLKTDPSAKIGDLTVTAISNGAVREAELKKAVAADPKAHIVATVPIDLSNPVVSTETGVGAMLTAHPDLTAVHSVYDNFLQATIKTIENKRSKAKVYSYFLAPSTVTDLRTKTPLAATVNVNLAASGLIAFDQLVNYFQKHTPIDPNAAQKNPFTYTIVTPANVNQLLKGGTTQYPTASLVAPFVTKWHSEYPG